MPTAQYSTGLTIGQVSIQSTVIRTNGLPNSVEETLPVGKSGSLTTRTDDDTGTFACTSHGLAVNDKADVYWSGAGNIRYTMNVSAVGDENTVTLDGGSGDNLPAQATSVVITKQVVIEVSIKADQQKIFGIEANSTRAGTNTINAHIHALDDNGTTIKELDLVENVPQIYDVEGGATNIFNPTVTGTFTAEADDEIITSNSHGLSEGHQVKVSNSGGALPTGLTAGIWYFVKYLSANTFSLATTLGGAAINLTTDGTGTQTWTRRNAITAIRASNGDTSTALTLKIPNLQDATA